MGKRDSGPGDVQFTEIDERWFSEWFEKGYRELSAMLTNHAAFDAWCAAHPPTQE